MEKSQIVGAIEDRVMRAKTKKYSIWTIGITANPDERRNKHGNPEHWMHWKSNSESDARDIEKHFLDKGMKGETGGGERPIYVYIF